MNYAVVTVLSTLVSAIIPTMAIYLMQRKIKQRDSERERKADEARSEQREANRTRRECELLLLESVNASIALGSATAIALKRGQANGEVEEALTYANEVKRRQRGFYHKQGIEHIYTGGNVK